MLKRMWEGDLSLKDKQQNGLELPSMLQGKCKIIHVQNILLLLNLLAFTCL